MASSTTDRAADLRSALATSARLATDVDAVLGRYEAGLVRVLQDVKPTVDKTQALRAARAEVRAALADAELTLHYLDTPRRVEAAVLAGPEADLAGFLRALVDLGGATAFLNPRRGDLPAAEAAVDSAATLRRDGLALALRNFVTLLQLHRGSGGGGAEDEAGGGEDGEGARSRPSEESGLGPGDEEATTTAAALDYDSEEGSDADGGGGADQQAPGTDPSPFLSRVTELDQVRSPPPPPLPPPGGLGAGSRATSIMPPPVLARLRALADAMVAAGNATCVKAYCDVRRGQLDIVLQALQAPVPLGASAGEGELGVGVGGGADTAGWVESWCVGACGLVRIATSERDLAAAVFDAPHAGEAAVTVTSRAVDLVVAAGQGLIATRRSAPKLMSLLTMLAAFAPVLDDLDAVLDADRFARILARLGDLKAALRTEARDCFAEFVEDVSRLDSWKGASAASSVLPLVAQTLSHLEAVLAHAPAFAAVCADIEPAVVEEGGETARAPPPSAAQDPASHLDRPPPPPAAAAALILRVLDALLDGLDAKAKASKSRTCAVLLTLNNLQYLVSSVTASPALAPCVPPAHLAAWRAAVEVALRDVRATLWAPLVDLLGSERPGGLSKESAKSLSAALQVIDEAKSALAIVDDDLRARVRDAVTAEVVEPYELLLTAAEPAVLKHLRHTAADARALVEAADFFVLRDDAAAGGSAGGGAVSAGGVGGASFTRR